MKDSAVFPHASARSGIYAAPESSASLRRSAHASGLAWFDLDLAGVDTKAALLVRCQTVFGLPPGFGHNWDALADSLGDFSWQPARGYIVAVTHGATLAQHAAPEFAAALEIFAAAATYWASQGRVFIVLLDGPTRGGRAYASLPA